VCRIRKEGGKEGDEANWAELGDGLKGERKEGGALVFIVQGAPLRDPICPNDILDMMMVMTSIANLYLVFVLLC
jgi:hypothetical protein